MRDSLTVLAILVIALLTAALVAPYFIDWNSHRALIEAKLSEAAGAPVTIAGPIDVKLLPEPIFRLGQVTIGSTASGQQSLTADEVDVEIALNALMRGEVQVVDATLRSPRLDVSAAANGAIRIPVHAVADPERVRFQHVAIRDGTLIVAVPGRGTLTASGIDLDGEATSLLGPFKASGRFGPADDSRPFRFATGAFESGKLRVKLSFEGAGTRPGIDIDGALVPGGTEPQARKAEPVWTQALALRPSDAKATGPSFDGSVTVSGSVPLSGSQANVPWSFVAHVAADADTATASDVELRAGADMRALVATGDGGATFGPHAAATLRLHGPQINLDALAVMPEGGSGAAPKGVELLTKLSVPATDPRWLTGVPLPFDLDYSFDTASVGDLTVLGIGGHVRLRGGEVPKIRFAANAQGNSRLAFDGSFEPGASPVFRGRLEAGVGDLPGFADRLGSALPDVSTRIKDFLPVRGARFAGTVDLSNVGIAARDATLSLDRMQLAGTLSYTRAVGADRARFFADLSSDALDLDAPPNIGGWLTSGDELDLQLALAARAVKLAPAGLGAVDAGRIALRLSRTAGALQLEQFSAELGSARVTATAALDRKTAHAEAHVDAPQLDAVADLLNRMLPGRATAMLKERSAVLSPANLDLRLDAASTGDGALLPTTLAVQGTANRTRMSVRLTPDRPGDIDPTTAAVSVGLTAEAPESVTLLRQLGIPLATRPKGTAEAPTIGPASLDAKAHGSMGGGFDTTMTATLGEASLRYAGKAKPALGAGHINLGGADLGRLLRALGLAPPGQGDPWPAEAEADLSWHDADLAFRRIGGRFDGVAIGGDLNTELYAPAGAQVSKPTLFGALRLERLPASALFALGLGPTASPAAAAWSTAPFGAAVLRLPRTEISLKVGTLGLRDGLDARNASLILRAENGALTLADVTGSLSSGGQGGGLGEGGAVGATLTLRRDGPAASLTGTVSWNSVALDLPGLAGRVGGTLDLAGSGNTPAALVGSLAGNGSMTVTDGRIPRLDPDAIGRTVRATEKNTAEIDADQVRETLTAELDRGALPLGDVTAPIVLAAGVARAGPVHVDHGSWNADAEGSLDLATGAFGSQTTLRARQPLPDWKSEPPQVTLRLKGPLAAPAREVDAASFVNALQLRAIARDQERIDIMQQDIRERAYFNRRLKAIEADQQAAREKAKSEADAARAKAEADARAKAQADAEAALARAKAAADARAAAEIERQLNQQASPSASVLPEPQAPRVLPASPSPAAAPRVLPGARLPSIGTGAIHRGRGSARPSETPSIIQERSPRRPEPSSNGLY